MSALYEPNVVGGAERSVQAIAESLVARGHKCLVATLTPLHTEALATIRGVEVVYLPLRNIYWPFSSDQSTGGVRRALWHAIDVHNSAMAGKAGRVMDRFRPHLISTHALSGFSTAVWRQATRRKIPLNHTIHDYWLLCPRTTMFNQGANCRRQCMECAVYSALKFRDSKGVDSVVGISQFVLDRHLERGWFPAAKHRRVIHNAGDVKARSAIRHRKAGPLTFGFLGRVVPDKGLHVVLAALKTLPAGTWQMCVGGDGDGPYLASLKSEYAACPVRFLGKVRPEEFFQDIDVLVVPSLWQEPLGRVVFEGYKHGVPVVAARSGGLPEMIEEGVTGFTYPPENRSDLALCLRRLTEDQEKVVEMGQAALTKAAHFTLERLSADYESHFRRVADGG